MSDGAPLELRHWTPPTRRVEDETNQGRYTPRGLVLELAIRHGRGAFDLDVAATAASAVAPRWYTKEENGILRPWIGRVFCNPPWNDIAPWVKKAKESILIGTAEVVVMVLPARFGTMWFASLEQTAEIERVYGRVSYLTPDGRELRSPFEHTVIAVLRRPLRAEDC